MNPKNPNAKKSIHFVNRFSVSNNLTYLHTAFFLLKKPPTVQYVYLLLLLAFKLKNLFHIVDNFFNVQYYQIPRALFKDIIVTTPIKNISNMESIFHQRWAFR